MDDTEVDDTAVYVLRSKLYTRVMANVSVTDARARLPELIARARTEAVFVERHGKTQAVLISPEQYERLMDALEDAEDARAFDEAMAEEGDNIPWEQAKADLGWD